MLKGMALATLLIMPVTLSAQSSREPAAAAQGGPLEGSAEGADVAAISGASAQSEKKICRTERMTGSLTRRSRICLTEREWARMREGAQRNVDNLVNDANQRQASAGNSGG